MTPTQHALHVLAFGASAVACVLLAPFTVLALGGLAVAALIQLMKETSGVLDALSEA